MRLGTCDFYESRLVLPYRTSHIPCRRGLRFQYPNFARMVPTQSEIEALHPFRVYAKAGPPLGVRYSGVTQRTGLRVINGKGLLPWVLLLAVASSLGCTIETIANRRQDVFHNVRNALVHVGQLTETRGDKLGKWLGSGFFADENCTIVTARHLFTDVDRERVFIRYSLPTNRGQFRTFPAGVFYEDKNRDLAFLRVENCQSKEINPLPLVADLTDVSPLGGEIVLTGGFPALGAESVDYPVVRRGMIASTEFIDANHGHHLLLLDLPGALGFSGGPVVLERTGEVIGVVTGHVKRPGHQRPFSGLLYAPEGASPLSQADYETARRDARFE